MLSLKTNLFSIFNMFFKDDLSPELDAAAWQVCNYNDWKITNLQLQKILYLAQMMHLGEEGKPLFPEEFQAWDYGPVIPELYQEVRGFGAKPVRDVFWNENLEDKNSEKILKRVCRATKGFSGGRLVANTHIEGGAWWNSYKEGVKGIIIPNKEILNEYKKRTETD